MTHKLDADTFCIFSKINPITHKSELKHKHVNMFNISVFIHFDYLADLKGYDSRQHWRHFNLDSVHHLIQLKLHIANGTL